MEAEVNRRERSERRGERAATLKCDLGASGCPGRAWVIGGDWDLLGEGPFPRVCLGCRR
jgi:hypothetical protein